MSKEFNHSKEKMRVPIEINNSHPLILTKGNNSLASSNHRSVPKIERESECQELNTEILNLCQNDNFLIRLQRIKNLSRCCNAHNQQFAKSKLEEISIKNIKFDKTTIFHSNSSQLH
jgi:hypothetical protein